MPNESSELQWCLNLKFMAEGYYTSSQSLEKAFFSN